MYECVLNNKEDELQFWFEDLKNNYTEVEEIKILELNNADFEFFKIDSSGAKLHSLMSVCDDTRPARLSNKAVLQVNDIFGHSLGDEALRLIGSRLKKIVRQGDLVARFGGDEFVLVIYDCDEWCAKKLAERMIEVVEDSSNWMSNG